MAASPTNGGTSHMLAAERAKCSFDVKKLMNMLGAEEHAKRVTASKALFKSHPAFQEDKLEEYMSYADRFQSQLAHAVAAIQITRDNPDFMMQHMAGKISMAEMFSTNGIGIHFFMFLTYLKAQGTKEQKKKWLNLAMEGKFLGCYCQTELGHGSNLRGLETTATFDKKTDEFIIHSPTLTSLKWWPTGMYASTHAVVMANVYIDGKNYGVQGFMVQLRDEKGYLLPGVEVGEMGPKIDPKKCNIGYSRFTNVRIPHGNHFSKFFQITREGEFISPPPKLGKFKNISMMEVRTSMLGQSAEWLSRASTIAIRYSCVRKQGFKDTTAGLPSGEYVIMDYKFQQNRLFSALALSYSIRWTSYYMSDYLKGVTKSINAGKTDAAEDLPELHATLAGLKAWCTITCHEHMEDVRKACGGQGFLSSSGLPQIVESFCDPTTSEGEQVIMSLQTSRFLIKSVKGLKNGTKPLGTVEYLLDEPMKKLPFTSWNSAEPAHLVAMFRERSRRKAMALEKRFSASQASGQSFTQATNTNAIPGYRAASCHSAYNVVKRNLDSLVGFVKLKDENTYLALLNLFELNALSLIQKDMADWHDLLTEELVETIQDRIHLVLDKIRPDAVGLVDATGTSDAVLKSTLGRYDGNVYEAIYQTAKKSPLNQSPKMIGWEELSKVLDLDFLKAGIGQHAEPASKL